MNSIKPDTGIIWVKEGFALFKTRPFLFTSLFFAYFITMSLIGIVPLIGQILPLLLAPSFSMLFMHVASKVAQGKNTHFSEISEIFSQFTSRNLLILGCLYLLAGVLAVLVSSVADGGMLWRIMILGAKVEPQVMQESRVVLAFFIAAGLYMLSVILFFWFAPPLIVWRKMKVYQAVFYSFFAVLHTWKAFLVYILTWILVGFLIPSLICALVSMMFGQLVSMLVAISLMMILSVLVYCSMYPTYVHIFGEPNNNSD